MKVVDTLRRRPEPPARRPVVRPQDPLGHQQRRRHRPTAASHRSTRPPASPGSRSRSTTRTTCTSRPTASRPSYVAEARKRLDFRDPHTMALQSSVDVPDCAGVNHADFTIDGRYVIFTCEFQGSLVKIDVVNRKVVGYLTLSQGGMPQDIRVVAGRQGVLRRRDDTAVASTPSTRARSPRPASSRPASAPTASTRAATAPSSTSRTGAAPSVGGPPGGPGSVSVIDFATQAVIATWPIPGGGSPDMGNVSDDGKTLWLSGRYDNVVYAIDTTSGNGRQDPGRDRAPRPHRLAPTRPLLPGPHRQHALTPVPHRRSCVARTSL